MNKLVLVLTSGLFLLAASAAKAQTSIVNSVNQSCLDTQGAKSAGKASVIQHACNGQQGQLFTLVTQQDGYALIKSENSKLCISAAGGATAPRTPLVTEQCSPSATGEMFKPIPQQGGGYALLNRRSGLCVSNAGSTTSGDPVLLADCDLYPAVAYTLPAWSPATPAASSIAAGTASSSAGMPAGNWNVISGLNIKGNYQLFGGQANGTLLINSKISGSLLIEGVQRVYIQGNTLGSIWMPDDMPTDSVTIDGNEITGGENDCIQIHDGSVRPTHIVIENNSIHDCGVGHPGSSLYHAIYVQVPDVAILRNHIWNATAAISIRSSGLVQGNVIEKVTNGGAIEYFSDHDAPPKTTLTIRGNTIRTTLTNSRQTWGSRRGLIVLGNGIASNHRPVSSFNVSSNFMEVLNTAVDDSGIYYNMYTQLDLPNARLSNNTLINLIPTGGFVGPKAVGSEEGDTRSHSSGSNHL
jgi:hypothetical protein